MASSVCGITPSSAGHHQHHDVGDLGAARAHAPVNGFVARRIDEDNVLAVFLHVIRADVLRDPAGFSAGHIGQTNRVQQLTSCRDPRAP